ncbi:tRNA (adenosine(37)-N6)-threonylcarbamoyltransferase complex ATPase subunit type 1 TsaE [Candidatus Saccharibacteria bacterium]|nr:tRNA (adenosine(37)-N6)-threonylcarbamoyltransferase complex ATPase subunit type 1 TsaE [Candidatus Saccharibacteria bacterium]
MKITHISQNEKDTEEIGERVGANLRGGEVVELRSDVGGGKTVFTRGLAHGAGSKASVSSPTFTITKEYTVDGSDRLDRVVHADMYRLQDPGVMRYELADAVGPRSVLVVEWADIVEDVLPAERLIVEITAQPNGDRQLSLTASDDLAYLLGGLS